MALTQPTVDLALKRLMRIDPRAYNPFHLFVGSGTEAGIVWSDGRKLEQERLAAGYHVITELSFDVPGGTGREKAIRRALKRKPSRTEMLELLSRDSTDPAGGARVRLPALGYGTRSSTWMEWMQGCSPRIAHTPDTTHGRAYTPVNWDKLTVLGCD